jgi:SAM-dependent methyltransferase
VHTEQNPYDLVAYPAGSFARTHPSNLAAMAILHGLAPAPVEQCRVLEIACNDGSNLIPIAYANPGAHFVGFDLAGQPVERGQERISELNLKNIRIFQGDVLDAGTGLGQFDYVIAHGLYSWVPEAVRDRLLGLCSELLAPDGIAFVSYNALPGGYPRQIIRDFLLQHVKGCEHIERQITDALGLMLTMIRTRAEGDGFRVEVESQIQKVGQRNPRSTFHDQLSESYHPVYFSDFARHAESHRLQYVCEALLPMPSDPYYKFEARSMAEKAAPGDPIAQEQLLDFARARQYRETLLCKDGLAVRRDLAPEYFRKLLLGSPAEISPCKTPGAMVFEPMEGVRIETDHPVVCTLVPELARAWPRCIAYEELEPKLAAAGFTLNEEGAALLMRLALTRMVTFDAWQAPIAAALSERSQASACARDEARRGTQATTLLHAVVDLTDPFWRELLQLLDGTRDRVALEEALRRQFPSEEIDEKLEKTLEFFRRAGMLEG